MLCKGMQRERPGVEAAVQGDAEDAERPGVEAAVQGDAEDAERPGVEAAVQGDAEDAERPGVEAAVQGDVEDAERPGVEAARAPLDRVREEARARVGLRGVREGLEERLVAVAAQVGHQRLRDEWRHERASLREG